MGDWRRGIVVADVQFEGALWSSVCPSPSRLGVGIIRMEGRRMKESTAPGGNYWRSEIVYLMPRHVEQAQRLREQQ